MTDPVREALAELVACKDLKERADAISPVEPGCEKELLMLEYQRRRPLAWAAARAVLAEPAPADDLVRRLRTYPKDGSRYAETLWTRCNEAAVALESLRADRDYHATVAADHVAFTQDYKDRLTRAEARVAELETDAERYRWLREKYLCIDFHYGDPDAGTALVFACGDISASANLDATIDAAKEGKCLTRR